MSRHKNRYVTSTACQFIGDSTSHLRERYIPSRASYSCTSRQRGRQGTSQRAVYQVTERLCHVTQGGMSCHTGRYVTSHRAVCHVTEGSMSRHSGQYVTSLRAVCHVTQGGMSRHTRRYVASHTHRAVLVCHVTQGCIIDLKYHKTIYTQTQKIKMSQLV